MKNPVEFLTEAKNLILTPDKWCKGAIARNKDGVKTATYSPDRCSLCSLGALVAVSGQDNLSRVLFGEFSRPYRYLQRACEELYDGNDNDERGDVSLYNDSHTHDEVLSMFDRAIELAKADTAGGL